MSNDTINLLGGHLDKTSLNDVLAGLRLARLSGSLAVSQGAVTKEIWFADGGVVGSKSNQREDSIGALLHLWGTISTESYRKLQLKEGVDSRLRFGEHLISMSAIDKETLRHALRQQVLWRVGDLFSWSAGTYLFTPGEVPVQIPTLSTREVFTAAVRRSLGADYLRQAETQLLDVVPVAVRNPPYEPLVLEETDLAALLNRITGKISFRGLIDPIDPARFWLEIFVLRELGCIRFDAPPELEALRKGAGHTPTFYSGFGGVAQSDSEDEQRSLFLRTAQASFLKGKKSLAKKEIEKAELEFKIAVTLNPEGGEYLGFLAWVRVLQHAKDRAVLENCLAMLRKAAHSIPGSADLAFFHASAHWLLGNHASALTEFERVLEIDPKHPEAALIAQRIAQAHPVNPVGPVNPVEPTVS